MRRRRTTRSRSTATVGGGFDYDFGLDVDWGAVDKLPDIVSDCLKSFADVLVGEAPKCSIARADPRGARHVRRVLPR